MFSNLSIRQKIFAQIATVLIALAGLIGTGLLLQRLLSGELNNSVRTGSEATTLVNTVRSTQVNFQRQVQEWKDMLLRGYDPQMYAKYSKQFADRAADVQKGLDETRAQMTAMGLPTQAVDKLKTDHAQMLAAYHAAYNANFDLSDKNQLSYRAVDTAVRGIDRATSAGFDDLVKSIVNTTSGRLQSTQAAARSETQRTLVALAIASALAGLAIILAIVIVNGILRNVRGLGEVVRRLSAGDFEARASIREKDELGQLGGALNSLLDQRLSTLVAAERENEKLNNSVVDIMSNVAQLAQRDLTVRVPVNEDVTGAVSDAINMLTQSTASALSDVQQISRNVSANSALVKERADTVQRLASEATDQAQATSGELGNAALALRQIGERAQAAGHEAERALTASGDALQVVDRTVAGINNSRDQIRETEKRVKRLAERSQEISQAVGIIGQIAERTSVLALNASMQAVAAGESGRGFAVVADEVKRLAENAREATQQISALVTGIQSDTAETLRTMNDTISQVVVITRLADQAGTQMNDTRQATEALARSVQEIAATTRTQSDASQRLLERADGLFRASQNTLEQIAEQRSATEALDASATQLVQTVSGFRLPQGA